MTIEQINSMLLSDYKPLMLERLGLSSASQAELEAEFEVYKAELIAEVERIDDLKSRYAAMSDVGLLQGVSGISNPDLHFQKEILSAPADQAESALAALEDAYNLAISDLESESWLQARQSEYAKIDNMLLEALAEKEEGRPEKMQEYLDLRDQIKQANPKPEE